MNLRIVPNNQPRFIQFTSDDCLHAAKGVVPAFLLIALGHVTVGVAFAIGLLPTSLMGIAPTRKLRVVYGAVGCLFGVGIFLGAMLASGDNTFATASTFFVVSFVSTLVASLRPAGALLLGILVPSLGVGTGYEVAEAARLMVAFIAGSAWSCLVMLPAPEFRPDSNVAERLRAMQPRHVRTYGVLLGLTAATSISVGRIFDMPYAGWIATAAMLVIRPVQDMTGWRGVGRALSTIVGTILVIATLHFSLGYFGTAVVCCAIAVLTIGARTSRLYLTAFGTAFLILTIELYGVTNTATLHDIGRYRILNNVLGAGIALFYGLLVSWLIERLFFVGSAENPGANPRL